MRWLAAFVIVCVLAGCSDDGKSSETGTPPAVAAPSFSHSTSPLVPPPPVPEDARWSFVQAEPIDHWAGGVRLVSPEPLDCWLNRTYSAHAVDAETLWAESWLLNGQPGLVRWSDGGPLFHAGVEPAGAPATPGLSSFLMGDSLRVRPEEGFTNLEFRLMFNRVSGIDWSAHCRAPGAISVTGTREVVLWGLDSVQGASVRVADTLSRTQGATAPFTVTGDADVLLCSHGGSGTAALAGQEWDLAPDMECEASRVGPAEHAMILERRGAGADDTFVFAMAAFQPLDDLGRLRD